MESREIQQSVRWTDVQVELCVLVMGRAAYLPKRSPSDCKKRLRSSWYFHYCFVAPLLWMGRNVSNNHLLLSMVALCAIGRLPIGGLGISRAKHFFFFRGGITPQLFLSPLIFHGAAVDPLTTDNGSIHDVCTAGDLRRPRFLCHMLETSCHHLRLLVFAKVSAR